MPRRNKEIKEQIQKLDIQDLQDIVISLASRDKAAYDYILLHYLDKENGEQALFEATKADLEIIFRKRHKGFTEELQLTNMLGACIKRINEFTAVSKNKVLEAELLLYILQVPFSLTTNLFGTCFTQYDTKVAIIVKRLITVVTKKLHEDYKVEYEDKINEYLQILHRTSNHLDIVCGLPNRI